MRKRLVWILFAALLGASAFQWYRHKTVYLAAARVTAQRAFPCSSPITYTIGAVDPNFNLSPEELRSYLKEAETVWEAAAGQDLFEFAASSADVTVNLVYDRRQAALDMLKGIGLVADQSIAAYKTLKTRYDELAADLDPRQAALASRLAEYKKGEAEYNAIVAEYNRRGAATSRQLQLLAVAKRDLELEFSAIKRLENGVNSDIDLLNALATTINQLIVVLELNAEQYKREGSALGVYEEGLYIMEGGLRRIDIYKHTGRAQLVRLLAHEMGHALGMDHVKGGESLMSPLNRGASLTLFPDDRAELDRACTSPLRSMWKKRGS